MDSKLKALAAEYEKARKQNIQLRNALQNEQEKNKQHQKKLLETRESGGANGGEVALTRRVESLQAELDLRAATDASIIHELREKVARLEEKNSSMSAAMEEMEKARTFDIGIQTERAEQSESDVVENLNHMVDHLNQQIRDLKLEHESNMAAFVRDKKLFRVESLDLPPELRVLDESDIGEAVEVAEADEESISAYFHLRIERLVSEIHSNNAKVNYYRAESETMGDRLRLTDSARLGALGDLRLEQENVRNLQSELTTTRKGYEAQLNTMTEELAQYLNPDPATDSHSASEKKSGQTTRSRFNIFSRNSH